MPSEADLMPLITEPREDLAYEYKEWLDLSTIEHRAVLAKAAIALANHGGGFIIIGFKDNDGSLSPIDPPPGLQEISQDAVNSAVRKFSSPEFHCKVYKVRARVGTTGHPVILVPSDLTEPVMSKRNCENVIARNRCYIRKPGPRSEEPTTAEEWRILLRRCVKSTRAEILESIRAIMAGHVDTGVTNSSLRGDLESFAADAREKWRVLTKEISADSNCRFPNGSYELAFALPGAVSAPDLNDLQRRLSQARRIKLSGWTPFVELQTQGWAPYPEDGAIEAWTGRPTVRGRTFDEPWSCDFWRASQDGKLYTIRGYFEDTSDWGPRGRYIDINEPIWRVAEGLLFARRFAETFEGAESIAMLVNFNGLKGRSLTSLANRRVIGGSYVCATDSISLYCDMGLSQIDDNLAEILHPVLSKFYERFNFFPLHFSVVQDEINRLGGGRF